MKILTRKKAAKPRGDAKKKATSRTEGAQGRTVWKAMRTKERFTIKQAAKATGMSETKARTGIDWLRRYGYVQPMGESYAPSRGSFRVNPDKPPPVSWKLKGPVLSKDHPGAGVMREFTQSSKGKAIGNPKTAKKNPATAGIDWDMVRARKRAEKERLDHPRHYGTFFGDSVVDLAKWTHSTRAKRSGIRTAKDRLDVIKRESRLGELKATPADCRKAKEIARKDSFEEEKRPPQTSYYGNLKGFIEADRVEIEGRIAKEWSDQEKKSLRKNFEIRKRSLLAAKKELDRVGDRGIKTNDLIKKVRAESGAESDAIAKTMIKWLGGLGFARYSDRKWRAVEPNPSSKKKAKGNPRRTSPSVASLEKAMRKVLIGKYTAEHLYDDKGDILIESGVRISKWALDATPMKYWDKIVLAPDYKAPAKKVGDISVIFIFSVQPDGSVRTLRMFAEGDQDKAHKYFVKVTHRIVKLRSGGRFAYDKDGGRVSWYQTSVGQLERIKKQLADPSKRLESLMNWAPPSKYSGSGKASTYHGQIVTDSGAELAQYKHESDILSGAKKRKARMNPKKRVTKRAVREALAKSSAPWEWVQQKPGRILASKGKRTVELRKWFKGTWDKGWVVSVIEDGELADEYWPAPSIMDAIKKGDETFKKGAKALTKKEATKKVAKKKARKKTPEWQLLCNRCAKLWDHYCERPSKTRLKPVLEHLEKMKSSTSKRVADERKACLRVANKEARRLKMK